jgi:hypothetical protein
MNVFFAFVLTVIAVGIGSMLPRLTGFAVSVIYGEPRAEKSADDKAFDHLIGGVIIALWLIYFVYVAVVVYRIATLFS